MGSVMLAAGADPLVLLLAGRRPNQSGRTNFTR